MDAIINGRRVPVEAGATIGSLLEKRGLQADHVVVEHNGRILERDRYARTPVNRGDTIELLTFVGGG